jgi:hypothetical protein
VFAAARENAVMAIFSSAPYATARARLRNPNQLRRGARYRNVQPV